MVTPLENVIIRLNQLGFFAFLPFLLTAAMIYGLLRRSRIFGDPEKNTAINATIAIVSAFMVWAYPILSGTSVEDYQRVYSEFFYRGTMASLFLIFGIVLVAVFSESLGFKLELSKHNKLISGIIIGIFVFLGLVLSSIFFGEFQINLFSEENRDFLYSIIFLIFFIAIIIIVVIFTSKEEKKS
ncbi:MAG: hypothetical protein QXL14_00840 [Candidatus Aenigmatarchaeota archaeon]